ncbi:hypothetical protein [Janthinobacterium sp. LB3P118]|uniref:hypothetical protein n=1 Tax=Janthinobacterium sp. LB3P118 TaxID=3424195 RepID=UPI003F29BE6F
MTFLAAMLRLSSNLVYFHLLMLLPAVLAVIFVKTLLWPLVVLVTRRLVLRYRSGWTVLAYPVLWGTIDTLMAALLPEGNWGSLAYSQADNLAVLQVAALAGVSALLFMLCLARSTGAWVTLGIGGKTLPACATWPGCFLPMAPRPSATRNIIWRRPSAIFLLAAPMPCSRWRIWPWAWRSASTCMSRP